MRALILAMMTALAAFSASAQEMGGWKVSAETPGEALSAKLSGKPRGILRVDCDRSTKAMAVKFSSGLALNKGEEPIRVVFLSFDKEEKLTKWVWSYDGRAATLTDTQAVTIMLNKLESAKTLQVSLRPVGKTDLNLRFRLAGAAEALKQLRAACGVPAPAVP